MANYNVDIDLYLNERDANKKLTAFENRLKNLQKRGNPFSASGSTKQVKEQVEGNRQVKRSAESVLTTNIKINAAFERRAALAKALTRTGLSQEREKEVQALTRASKLDEKNLGLQNAVNTALERILQTQREINRSKNVDNSLTSKVRAGISKRIGLLKAVGATESEIARVQKASNKVVASGNEKRSDEARELFRQLERQLTTLERKYKTFLDKPQRQLASPIDGSEFIEGSPKFKAKETKDRDKNAKAIDRERRALERKNKTTKREAKAAKRSQALNRKRKFTDIAAGVGFPLLFGGGPGSVAGGAIGGIFGGMGGSVLGGAIGQQFDKLGAAAISTAKAFDKLGSTASDLIPKLGRGTGGGFGGQAEFLISQGRESQVANILRERFSEVYGDQALRDFENLAQVNREFEQALNEVGVELQRLMAGPLGALLKALQGVSNGLAGRGDEGVENMRVLNDRFTSLQLQANKITEGGGQLSLDQKDRLEKARLAFASASPDNQVTDTQDAKNDAQKKQNALITKEKDIQDSINVQKITAINRALTARRDELAILNTAASITKATTDLERTKTQLTAERKKEIQDTNRILKLETEEAEQQADLGRQRAAQANAVLLAERQIRQELRTLSIQEFSLTQQISDAQSKKIALISTEETQYNLILDQIDEQYQTTVDNLAVQEAIALEGKNELNIRNKITENFKKQNELALKNATNRTIEVMQAEVLRKDRLQAIKDQEKLNRLSAENAAIKSINSNDPERTASFAGAGLGFFGSSELVQANTIRDSAAQLEFYNEQIGRLQSRIESLRSVNLNDARIAPQQEELDRLVQARQNYQDLQPAIDAATIKQARFNDALALTTPVVDSLFNSLQAVAEGTKTAEQAFADFLRSIADMLMQAAQQMIAQYIAIGIAKMFAGMGSGGSGKELNLSEVTKYSNVGANTRVMGFADGGRPPVGRPSIVGERGPELFVPGASGTIIPNHAMGGGANVTVNVDASGSNVEGDGDQAAQLGKAIGIAVQQELIKQKRPGGLLTR